MASYYENTQVYDYSWKQVVQAFWNRYPNPLSLSMFAQGHCLDAETHADVTHLAEKLEQLCNHSTTLEFPAFMPSHVLTEDTIEREVRDGKLYTRRLLSKTNHVPKWGERFYHSKSVKIVEDSMLDLKKRTLVTYTRNIGYKRIMSVDEKVEYKEREDGKTVAVRSAWISSQVFGFSRAIRAFGVERFKNNCHKAALGFNHILVKMFPKHSINIQHSQEKTTTTIKDAAKNTYSNVKSQASKIYDVYSAKN